jgi:hypothetical protein
MMDNKINDEDLFNPLFWRRCLRDVPPLNGTDIFLRQAAAETGIPYEKLKRRCLQYLKGEWEHIAPGTPSIN